MIWGQRNAINKAQQLRKLQTQLSTLKLKKNCVNLHLKIKSQRLGGSFHLHKGQRFKIQIHTDLLEINKNTNNTNENWAKYSI